MTKLEFIDLVRELLPQQPHRMTVEKLASIVYSDSLKLMTPSALSKYRKPYTVDITANVGTIPVPYIPVDVLIPSDDLMYVPVGLEEMNYLAVIDDIDTTISYCVSGNTMQFANLPDSITQVTVSLVPSLEALSDLDQVDITTEQIVAVLKLISPQPEKYTNDRNLNNL